VFVRWRGATATCSSRCTAAMTGVMLVMTISVMTRAPKV
jgi:hypothetical protein